METVPTIPLTQRLAEVAGQWATANDATLAKLGRQVVNDGGFFTRLETAGASTTTATLEKFARFLADPANWPEGAVPEGAVALAHVTGINLGEAEASAGNAGDSSPEVGRAAA